MTTKSFHYKQITFHSINSTFHDLSLSKSESFFVDITELKAIFFKPFTKKECFYKRRIFLRSYQYFIAVIRNVVEVCSDRIISSYILRLLNKKRRMSQDIRKIDATLQTAKLNVN